MATTKRVSEGGMGEPMLADTERIAISRARRRLLYGKWSGDAVARMKLRLGAIRKAAVGSPDLSANPLRSVCHQAAVLYDRAPRLSHPDDDADRTLARALERATAEALWSSKAQRVQRDALGIREMLWRLDTTSKGRIVLRPVFPDRVDLEPDPEEPDRIGRSREARARIVSGSRQWTYDEITAAESSYVVQDAAGKDVTEQAIGGPASGDAYPFRWEDGDPFSPYVLIHATPTGELWDPSELHELYEASLETCVLWTFWGHLVRDASWPQRWVVDLVAQGATTEGPASAPREALVTDPSTVVRFTRAATDPGGTPTPPGQWAPGGDPLALAEALMVYEQRIAGHVGVIDPEFIRRSGDPRSGYALSISRDGQRAASRKYEPQFRAADVELISKIAAMLNRHREDGGEWDRGIEVPELPETGWRIRYLGLPLTPEEQTARRDEVLALLDRKLISRVRAYATIHELEEDEAARELEEIDLEGPATAGRTVATTTGATTTTQAPAENGAGGGVNG